MILLKISKEIKKINIFCVMTDETKDVSKTEQLSNVFFQGEIKKRFLGFTCLKNLNSDSLSSQVKF